MYIPNDEKQNSLFCRLQLLVKTFLTQLNESTNHNLLKVPKVVKPANKKMLLKTLGTSVINSPLSPSFLLKSKFSFRSNLLEYILDIGIFDGIYANQKERMNTFGFL